MSRRNVAAALGTTLLTQAIGSATTLAPAVLAPLIAASMGLSITSIGLYVSLVYVAAMVSTVLAGPFVVALGGTRVSQVGLCVCAIGLSMVSSSHVVIGALGALVIGLGYGPLTPASADVLIRAAPPHRMAVIYSLKQTGVPLGGVLAGLLLPAAALVVGWSWALAGVSGACLLCALTLIPFRSGLDGTPHGGISRPSFHGSLEPIRLTLRNPSLRILAISSFVFSATQLCLTVYLVTFLTQSLQWQIVAAGAMLAASQAVGAFTRVLWGWVADTRAGLKLTLIYLAVAMAVSALSMLVIDASTPRWIVALLIALFAATAAGWNGVFLAAVARTAPPGRTASVTGGAMAFTYLGIVVGPTLFGSLADRTDSFPISFAALAIPLSLCVLLLTSLKSDRA
ncbi:MAG: MFS transporter [Burkholderiaceae bacterium]|nr:MFS transporter [Burkholderiaceae bacterium]